MSGSRANTELGILHAISNALLVSVSCHYEPILQVIRLKIKEMIQLIKLIQTVTGVVISESEPWLHYQDVIIPLCSGTCPQESVWRDNSEKQKFKYLLWKRKQRLSNAPLTSNLGAWYNRFKYQARDMHE